MTFPRGAAGFTDSGIFSRIIVVISKSGQGIFGYSPSPGANNLVFSISSVGGTDPYLNVYLPGYVSYINIAGTFYAVQINAGLINWYSGGPTEVGAIWTQTSQISGLGSPDLLFQSNRNIVIGSNPLLITAAASAGDVCKITNTQNAPTAPNLEVVSNAAGDNAFGLRIVTDTNSRLKGDSSGVLHWGPGNVTQDTNLYRNGVGILQTDGTLVAIVLRAIAALSGNQALDIHVTGDTNPRYQITGSGFTQWGPGNAAVDTNLYRSAAGLLAADPIAFNNAGVAETMQAITFANSWTQAAGRVVCGYRRINVPNEMEFMGSVVVPAGFASGQNMDTAAPAAYQPTHTNSLIAIDTTTNLVVRLAWGTNGILQFIGPVANTAATHILDIPVQRIHLTQ